MQHNDTSFHLISSPGWELLGDLELTVNPDTDHTVSDWLGVILSPLNLHADFARKVLRSAQDAAARIWQTEAAIKLEHIHFLIFVPIAYTSTGPTWGFFRIEKIESAATDKNFPDHAIEFYLYLEGP